MTFPISPAWRRFTRTAALFSLSSPLALGAFLVASPSVVVAALSTSTGIQIPRNGEIFDAIAPNFTSLLSKLGQEKIVALPPAGEAETFVWKGENYKENRVAFTKTAVTNALTAAGYVVTKINDNELREINIFEHFDSNDESIPFHQSVVKNHDFYQATDETKGKAILFAWLEDDNALALGLMPVAFKAKPRYAPIPAVGGTNVVLVKDKDNAMKGLPQPKLPVYAPLTRKRNSVRGWIKDGSGKPIAGAEVAVYSSLSGGLRTTHKARSNAQGLYEVMIPTGVGEVAQGSCKVNYNGVTYDLLLQPAAGSFKQFNSANGHIENFVLRTSGNAGATIRTTEDFKTGTLEITLTPMGKLLDGSTGRTFVFRLNKADGNSENYLNGLPIGRYRLTARLFDEGETLPLQVYTMSGNFEADAKSSLQVDFKPGYTFSQVNYNKGARDVQFFEVAIKP